MKLLALCVVFLGCGYSEILEDEFISLPIEFGDPINDDLFWKRSDADWSVKQPQEENWAETLARLCRNNDLSWNDEIVDCDTLEIVPKSLKIDRQQRIKREAEPSDLQEGSGNEPAENKLEPREPVPAQAASAIQVTAAQVPTDQAPAQAAEVPVAQVPTDQAPAQAAEVPVAQVPVAQVPAAQVPAAQVPAAQVPTESVPDKLVLVLAPAPVKPDPAEQTPKESAPIEPEPAARRILAEKETVETVPEEKVPAEPVPVENKTAEPIETVPAKTVPAGTVAVENKTADPAKPVPVGPEATKESESGGKEEVGDGKKGRKITQEYLNDKQSGVAVVDGLGGTMEDADAALGRAKPNESLKTGEEEPKSGQSSEDPAKASPGSNKLLIGLFVGVVVVGAAAFTYNYIRKRNGRGGSHVLDGDVKDDVEEGKEMKPLMNLAERNAGVEYKDEKEETAKA